jgi:hypothetical protein
VAAELGLNSGCRGAGPDHPQRIGARTPVGELAGSAEGGREEGSRFVGTPASSRPGSTEFRCSAPQWNGTSLSIGIPANVG